MMSQNACVKQPYERMELLNLTSTKEPSLQNGANHKHIEESRSRLLLVPYFLCFSSSPTLLQRGEALYIPITPLNNDHDGAICRIDSNTLIDQKTMCIIVGILVVRPYKNHMRGDCIKSYDIYISKFKRLIQQ